MPAGISSPCRPRSCAVPGPIFRWCSRIRMARSIPAAPWAGRSPSRSRPCRGRVRPSSASRSLQCWVRWACGRGMRRSTRTSSPAGSASIAIARALITRPKLIVADEPVSALDVSVQAQVLNLMRELEQRFGVTYLLISHDLAVVNYIAAEVAVMYRGRIVEQAEAAMIFRAPAHPYTRALLEAVPRAEPGRQRRRRARAETTNDAVEGGCPFRPRCPYAVDRCRAETPALRSVAGGHAAACHRAEDILAEPPP